jgi:HD-GYP domain-containing protein (c-di-GMP phosphodiesterase class II)
MDFFLLRNRLERAKRALGLLSAAQRSASLYPEGHPILAESIDALHGSVSELLSSGEPAVFNFHKGSIFFEQVVLPQESIMHSRLMNDCRQRHVGSITFLPGLTRPELAALINLLNADAEQLEGAQDAAGWLLSRGVSHITVAAVSELDGEDEDDGEGDEDQRHRIGQEAGEIYRLAIDNMRAQEEAVLAGRTPELAEARKLSEGMLSLMLQDRGAVVALSTIKSHDQYTLHHSVNVMILALALGTMLPLDNERLRELGFAALMHDIGKITVPTDILRKPGPLTTEEWKAMRRHPQNGAHILDGIEGVSKSVMVVAFEHHMRHDLQGYPTPYERQKLHLYSRVVAIADAYDAMTTDRAYREPLRPDKAVAVLLRESRKAFDPTLVKVFINLLGIYPISTFVRLSTGETGVVYEANPNDLLRPKVKLVFDADRRRVDGQIVDLTEIAPDGSSFARSITESVDESDYGIDASSFVVR